MQKFQLRKRESSQIFLLSIRSRRAPWFLSDTMFAFNDVPAFSRRVRSFARGISWSRPFYIRSLAFCDNSDFHGHFATPPKRVTHLTCPFASEGKQLTITVALVAGAQSLRGALSVPPSKS
jgi:hypothetical protein